MLWHRYDPSVDRVVLLGLCLDSLHTAEIWAYVLGLYSGPAHVLLSAPSESNLLKLLKSIIIYKRIEPILSVYISNYKLKWIIIESVP